jgi:hypothetical protein
MSISSGQGFISASACRSLSLELLIDFGVDEDCVCGRTNVGLERALGQVLSACTNEGGNRDGEDDNYARRC